MRGDAAIHKSTLLHGVQVLELDDTKNNNNTNNSANQQQSTKTERWSWIIWYRDSPTCDDYSHEWFATCAEAGDAVCQQLHATKVGNIPGQRQPSTIAQQVLQWNARAAAGGSGVAAVKMARAYLKLLPSDLTYDEGQAARYYELAIQSQEPDGHYGMASLLLLHQQRQEQQHPPSSLPRDGASTLTRVVYHLEAAAKLRHPFAMFNLGMVHTFGYGVSEINTTLAVEWFVASGLPEGYYVAYFQAASVADQVRMDLYQQHAQALGMNQPWRKQARQHTGSGGAAGVDLNLPWPPSADGRQPPVL
eukprot:scaffold3842_cov158-Amphora_coffeaeformis.AAC.9